MSLATVTRGKIQRPDLMLVYGLDGVGKSTLASEAPSPIFLGSEAGTNNLDVSRDVVDSYGSLLATLGQLAKDKHDFKTVVLDTADWAEKLVYAKVVEEDGKPIGTSIDKVDKGFGKGRVYAFEKWRDEIIPAFNACRDRGMNVIILAHSMVKKFEDPSTPQGYDRYQLKLQDGAKTDVAGLLREWVDTVMFATYKVETVADDTRRAFGGESRVLYTERRPSFDAKNRIGLPFEIPFKKGYGWAAYEEAKAKAKAKAKANVAPVAEDLSGLVAQLPADIKPAVEQSIKMATGNPAELARIKAKMLLVISQGKEKS